MQLLRAHRRQLIQARAQAPAAVVAKAPVDAEGARAKGEIVRALRKKK